MKTLKNSIIVAVLTISSLTITQAQVATRKGWDGSIKGNKTETSTQSVSSEKEAGSEVDFSQKASAETTTEVENRSIDKKDIRRTSSANQNPLYEEKNKEGVNPLYEAQRKGIRENGLKKNEIDVFQEDNTPTQTEGKTKGKVTKLGNNGMISVSEENQETPTARKGWDGSVKGGTAAQRKGIKEGGLKKNDADINTTSSEKKGLNAVNVKLSKTNSEQASDQIKDVNPVSQDHAVKTKGTGATTGGEFKTIIIGK